MSPEPDPPPPTGTAAADLLTLEFAEPPPAAAHCHCAGPREAAGEVHPIGPRPRRSGPALDHLDARMAAVINRAGVGHVATADAVGLCESSFREVKVIDSRHIAYPGDGPPPAAVGVLLVDLTGEPVGVHVNGRARAEGGWVVVEVEEAWLHSPRVPDAGAR